MARQAWVTIVFLTTLVACSRPAETSKTQAPAAAGPTVERPSPFRWNATSGAFELNGKALKAIKLWTFDGSTDGFTPVASKVAPAAGSGLAISIADPSLRSPKGLNVVGGQYPLVLVRITRTRAGSPWDGALYYTTSNHPESISFFGKPLSGANPKPGETTTLVYDMSRQTAGAPDWAQSTIDQIRFDLDDRPGGAFVIRQIAITDNPDPAAFEPPAPPAAPAAPASPKS